LIFYTAIQTTTELGLSRAANEAIPAKNVNLEEIILGNVVYGVLE